MVPGPAVRGKVRAIIEGFSRVSDEFPFLFFFAQVTEWHRPTTRAIKKRKKLITIYSSRILSRPIISLVLRLEIQ